MANDDMRYSLATDGIPDLEDLWADYVDCNPKPPTEDNNSEPQIEESKPKKTRIKKINILIAIYIILVVTELFFYVPYHNIQVFKSTQNVPHTEIIGSGYTTMADIASDDAYIIYGEDTSKGKKVNTSQIFINVLITTVLAIVIYFLLQKNEDAKGLPVLDVNALAFAAEEEIEQAQRDYAKEMFEYVKGNKNL